MNSNQAEVTAVSFGGGGNCGTGRHIAVAEAYRSKNIALWMGTSIGGFIAVLMANGFSEQEMKESMYKLWRPSLRSAVQGLAPKAINPFKLLKGNPRQLQKVATYFGLLAWLQRFEPIGQTRTINALMSAVDDPILEQQIAALQGALFAPEGAAVAWSPRTLIRHVRSARRTLLRRSRHGRTTPALPQQINPADVRTTRSDNRRVAR